LSSTLSYISWLFATDGVWRPDVTYPDPLIISYYSAENSLVFLCCFCFRGRGCSLLVCTICIIASSYKIFYCWSIFTTLSGTGSASRSFSWLYLISFKAIMGSFPGLFILIFSYSSICVAKLINSLRYVRVYGVIPS